MFKKSFLNKTAAWVAFSFLLAFSLAAQSVQARISNNTGDEVVTPTDTEDNVFAHMILPNISAATTTVLVDLSDNQNFKHLASSGSVDISSIRVDWQTDIVATSSTHIRIGVIASTSPSGSIADIYWFDSLDFFAGDDTNVATASSTPPRIENHAQTRFLNYAPSTLKTRITSGAPKNFITNDISSSTTAVATTSALTSPHGVLSVFPAVGDVVFQIYSQIGNATTTATVSYRVTP